MHTLIFYSLNILYKAYLIFVQLLPYLIIGVMLGEILKYVRIHKYVDKLQLKNNFFSSLTAAVLGVISPLCTYGTVPVVLQLKNCGVPISVLIVFLIASSMMNPQLFLMTWGGLSARMAAARVISIIIFTILIGWLINIVPQKWIINKKSLDEISINKCESYINRKEFVWKNYFVSVLKNFEFIGFYIVIGAVLAAAIEVAVPASYINKLFEYDKTVQVVLVSIFSIPFYTCGGGIIPVTKSFMLGGMSSGTALAFLNVGSATRITTLMALAAILRPAAIFTYVLLLIVFSVIIGYIFI